MEKIATKQHHIFKSSILCNTDYKEDTALKIIFEIKYYEWRLQLLKWSECISNLMQSVLQKKTSVVNIMEFFILK